MGAVVYRKWDSKPIKFKVYESGRLNCWRKKVSKTHQISDFLGEFTEMFSKFCRIDTNKPLSFIYICINYVFTFTCALYIHYLYVQQVSPSIFSPTNVQQAKKSPATATSFGIQADGVSGVIHSATRLALQLFLNSERAGKIDKDGELGRLVLQLVAVS